MALYKYEGPFSEVEIPVLGIHVEKGEAVPMPDELVAGLGPDWSEAKPKSKSDKEKSAAAKEMTPDPAPAEIKSKDSE